MTLIAPTLQGRAGFDPNGHGAGVQSPFGRSPGYLGGTAFHNGEDHFWLGAASAARLGISTTASKDVYPCLNGPASPIDDPALGIGVWQQIDAQHRVYYWHMSRRIYAATESLITTQRLGVMGSTGSAAGDDDHLHLEVRKAPYRMADRINPRPFFTGKGNGPAAGIDHRAVGAFLNTHAGNLRLPTTTTAEDGDPGSRYWRLVQALGRAWSFYDGAVDGKPGPKTYAANAYIWENYVKPKPPVVTPPPIVHTVTLSSGTADVTQKVEAGKLATRPADPVRAGFTFEGWTVAPGLAAYDFKTPVTSDLTLIAAWLPVKPDLPPQHANEEPPGWLVRLLRAIADAITKFLQPRP